MIYQRKYQSFLYYFPRPIFMLKRCSDTKPLHHKYHSFRLMIRGNLYFPNIDTWHNRMLNFHNNTSLLFIVAQKRMLFIIQIFLEGSSPPNLLARHYIARMYLTLDFPLLKLNM